MGQEHALYYGEIDWNGQTDLFSFFELKKMRVSPFSRFKIFSSKMSDIQLHISYEQIIKFSKPFSVSF